MQISQKRDMKRPYIHHVLKLNHTKIYISDLIIKVVYRTQTGLKLNSQPIQNQSTLKVEPNRAVACLPNHVQEIFAVQRMLSEKHDLIF